VGLELFEEHVAGNFKKTVGDEEDDECSVELCAVGIFLGFQPQVCGEVVDFGVGNVDTVCEDQRVSRESINKESFRRLTYQGMQAGTLCRGRG
jgi:hypothetical protein